jgi:hypothetical protein
VFFDDLGLPLQNKTKQNKTKQNKNLIQLSSEPYRIIQGTVRERLSVCVWGGGRGASLMEELEKGLKELRGFAAPWREQQCQPARTPRAPRD